MKVLLRLGLMLSTAAALVAAPVLRIEDLGTLGGSQASGMAINRSGQIAGFGSDALGGLHAFTTSGGMTDITPSGSSGATASGINATGQVAGTTFTNGRGEATLWSGGTAQIIGGLGGPESSAMAVNDRGQVAGMATSSAGDGRAFVFENGVFQDISLPGTIWSSAYGINNYGFVVGYAMTAGCTFEAYSWSSSTGFTPLGTLGGRDSYAMAVNDSNQIVGHSSDLSGYSHAFVASNGSMHDIGTLGGNLSYAYGINNGGSVVGYSTLASSGSTHAFLYFGGVLFDLNQLVSNLGGWELTAAYGINDAGQITGSGLLNGVEHAFRLDPVVQRTSLLGAAVSTPEPGTAGTVVLALTLLVGGLLLKRK